MFPFVPDPNVYDAEPIFLHRLMVHNPVADALPRDAAVGKLIPISADN